MRTPDLDIIIPVYNEAENIGRVLESLLRDVKTPFRVLLCYDHDDDTTLPVARKYAEQGINISFVKNRGSGPFAAVITGYECSSAPAVLVFPGDDDYNSPRLDDMMRAFREGNDIVAASRLMPGGCMKRCPLLKEAIIRSSAFALHRLAQVPTHDPSNGFRLFSQRVLRQIPIESSEGFSYSIELLVKSQRLGWPIAEVPVAWYERKAGKSRFKVLRWLPAYWTWFCYAFETRFLSRGPETLRLRTAGGPAIGASGDS